MKSEKKSIAVFFGGRSCERDVSLITGVLAVNCIDRESFKPLPVLVTENGFFSFEGDISVSDASAKRGAFEVVFKPGSDEVFRQNGLKLKSMGRVQCAINCCHGLNGEDGCISGLMRLCRIPFASPDMFLSSLSIDKAQTKIYLQGLGVNVLPCRVVASKSFFENRELEIDFTEKKIGYPCMVKPSRLGSSIGVCKAENRSRLVAALEAAFRYDSRALVEKALEGAMDINCAAYMSGGRIEVSECENPKPGGSLYTFEDKYISGLKRTLSREFPANLPRAVSDKIKEITALVYRRTFAVGIIRIDFLVSGEEVYLNEINTVPGSLALYLFKDSIAKYKEVLNSLIAEGIKSFKEFESLCFTYDTSMIGALPNKGAK